MFASRLNYQMKPYVSWHHDPEACAVNGFTLFWGAYRLIFCFAPFSLLGKILMKVEEDKAEMLLVAPIWTTQYWFPRLLRLSVDCPRILPKQRLLSLPQDLSVVHPLQEKMNLTVFRLSGNRLKTKAFQTQLQTLFCPHGEVELKNNIGVITKNGCCFALDGILIPFHRL